MNTEETKEILDTLIDGVAKARERELRKIHGTQATWDVFHDAAAELLSYYLKESGATRLDDGLMFSITDRCVKIAECTYTPCSPGCLTVEVNGCNTVTTPKEELEKIGGMIGKRLAELDSERTTKA